MKWYDYPVCVWFAFTIWVAWLAGDVVGMILNYIFYLFYTHIRKNEVNTNGPDRI